MTGRDHRLLRDPVFQLNVILWLVFELPANDVRPLLRNCGYLLRSIAPRLPLPPEVRGRVANVASADPPSPDLLLAHESDPTVLVIECKASSFGPDTEQAQQAIKLVAVSANLSGPLGLPVGVDRPGHVLYVLPGEHAERVVPTLGVLQERLRSLDVEAAPAGAIRLDRDDRGLLIGPARGDQLPPPAADVLDESVVAIHVAPEDDPRPLYLIPWDPSVEQEPDLADYGRWQLGARILNAMIGRVGRITLPAAPVIRMDELLQEATFGASRYWRDPRAVDRVLRSAQRAIFSAIQAAALATASEGTSPIHVQVRLASEEEREALIEALEAADELQAGTPQGPPAPTLFETLDEES